MTTVLDKLCMVTNINTRKLIELKKVQNTETKIQALQEMINSLQEKLSDQSRRLDALNSKEA
jgi:predicted RNase H-like nuclease (RuvC/YqgF family)